MPLSKKGKKIKAAMVEQYGEEKGKKVFYASKNAGKISGVDAAETKTEFTGKYPEYTGHGAPGKQPKKKRPPPGNASDAWSEQSREAAAEARKRRARVEQSVKEGVASYRRGQEKAKAKAYPEGRKKYKEHIAGFNKTLKGYERGGFGGHMAVAYGAIDNMLVVDDKPAALMQDHGRLMYDAVSLDDVGKIEFTEEGYLKAVPRIARTGIQLYGGDECGVPEKEWVRVYRPDDQVFKTKTVHGYARLPITLDHPGVPVASINWKDFAVGETGDDVLRDGNSVRVPFMLRDAKAIAAYKAGNNQLSVGYTCDLLWKDGKTEDGEEYDAVQTNIAPNHLAVVAAARGGPLLTIGDNSKGESVMTVKMTVDEIQCTLADEQSASVIQRALNSLRQQLVDAKKKSDEDDDEKEDAADALRKLEVDSKKALDAKDGEIAVLKQQVIDAKNKIHDEIKNLMYVSDRARALSPRIKTEGRDANDIRREIVVGHLADAKTWSDEKIEGAFNAMTANARPAGQPVTTLADVTRSFQMQTPMTAQDAREQAYADAEKRDAEAWRTGGMHNQN